MTYWTSDARLLDLTQNHPVLGEALLATGQLLTQWADGETFFEVLDIALGETYDRTRAEELRQELHSVGFGNLGAIAVRSSSELGGALGAYAAATGTIYLSSDLLAGGTVDGIAAVLLEEIGHGVDSRLNAIDAPGDEGDIFSRLVRGESLTQIQLAGLTAEDDAATIVLDGVEVAIEQAGNTAPEITLSAFPASFELSDLAGSNGFVLNGIDDFDISGISVSGAGDVNGDGVDDLIIGARGGDPNGINSAGESYVVFGASSGFNSSLELSNLDGSNGFVLNGIDDFDNSGLSVSGAGDVNGDGIDDLIIGADDGDPNGDDSGESYVVFGASSGFNSSLELSNLDGSNGFVLNGIDIDDFSGRSVSGAGDVNGDGFDDLIIGALRADPNGDDSGESYVVFGASSGFNSSLELSNLDGSNGFVLNGIDERDFSGRSVSGAGDVNGDGFDDLIIGAPYASPNGDDSGESYVVFGASGGFNSSLELSNLDGSNGFVLNGIAGGDRSGFSVSGAGDVNGDGVDDLIIGADGASPNGINGAGESYVVFGASSGFNSSLELSNLDGSNGFVLNGIDFVDGSGSSVSGAGDVNGDGFDDLIIGAQDADPNGINRAGESYVVFGASSGFNSSLELSNLDGSNGFLLNGIDEDDFSGDPVSGVGDVNGDGFDDLIIGAPDADPNGDLSGESYVVFGGGVLNFTIPENTASVTTIPATDAEEDTLTYSISGGADSSLFTIDSNTGALSFLSAPDFEMPQDQGGDNVYEVEVTVSDGQLSDTQSFSVIVTDAGENTAPEITLSGFFRASFDLSDLDGSNGFVLNGIDENDNSGRSVSGAGDVNGDGFDDLIIGAPDADPNGRDGAGESYVVFGKSSGFTPTFELSSLDGSNGFVLNGIDGRDFSGASVSGAGDVNGDGFDDLIIGARTADPNGGSSGESYVVFGASSGFNSSLELSNLDGSNGFVLNGIDSSDGSGTSVSGAGDVNGDGVDDLIIGADEADPNGGDSGESYVVFGASSGFNSSLELSNLDGSNGFVLNGIDIDDFSGESVSGAGDVNGDGVDDLIIGAFLADPNGDLSGESYVVFGASSGFNSSLELSNLDGSNGFVLNGIDRFDNLGESVSGAGDVNGDGVDDLIIGAPGGDPNGFSSGESYVVFGASSGFNSSLELSNLDGSNGFVLNGIDFLDDSGNSVSGAGDVNGDGVDDLIIGAIEANPNGINRAGESYVVFGASSGFNSSLELSNLDGSNGFVLNGIDDVDLSGNSVSGAGDVNGDGFDDLIIGARRADPNGVLLAGQSYVVFGRGGVNFTVPENTASVTTIPATDAEGDPLTYSISGGADSSLFTINSNTGALSFLSAPDFEMPQDQGGDNVYEVEVTVSDGNGGTDTATFTVTIEGNRPTAIDDSVTTDEDTPLSGNVLANDSDPESDPLTAVELNGNAASISTETTLPSGALVTLNADGSFDYDPNGQFESLDDGESTTNTFNYTISNGDLTDTATVSIAIAGINDAPISTNDSASTDEDTAFSFSGNVLANDSDPESDPLTVTELNGDPAAIGIETTLPSGALVTLSADGSFDYDPNGAFEDLGVGENTTDTFTYTVSDGDLTDTATVEIAIAGVNDRPSATNDRPLPSSEFVVPGIFGITADSTANLIEVLANDSDPDGDSLTIVGVTQPVNGGTVNNLGNAIEYTPAANFFGQDRFEYTISDGNGGTDTATVVVAVINDGAPTATNDRPLPGSEFAVSGVFSTVNDTAIIDVLANDSDPNGDPLTIAEVTQPVNGSTSIVGNAIEYTPATDFVGQDRFEYTISDGNGGTDTAIVTVSVAEDRPLVIDGTDGPDQLEGELGDDTINGLGGDDGLFGGAGNDTLNGGDGIDLIKGQVGDDMLNGGLGNDQIFGDTGNDTLNGDGGNDELRGNDGNDILNGGDGNDRLGGVEGDDILNGGDGNDRLDGGVGNDTLNGDAGDDRLQGREGNDTLDGGAGSDTLIGVRDGLAAPGVDELDVLTGGSESDRFVLGNAAARFYVGNGANDFAEITDFEVGIDTIELQGPAGDYTFTLAGGNTEISVGGDLVANVVGVAIDSTDVTFI